jgi:hypothetical protein
MQTFIVKVAGNVLTANDIKKAVWQTIELADDEIIVEGPLDESVEEIPMFKGTLQALEDLDI